MEQKMSKLAEIDTSHRSVSRKEVAFLEFSGVLDLMFLGGRCSPRFSLCPSTRLRWGHPSSTPALLLPRDDFLEKRSALRFTHLLR